LRLSSWLPKAARQARTTSQPFVAAISNHTQQFFNASVPDRLDVRFTPKSEHRGE